MTLYSGCVCMPDFNGNPKLHQQIIMEQIIEGIICAFNICFWTLIQLTPLIESSRDLILLLLIYILSLGCQVYFPLSVY